MGTIFLEGFSLQASLIFALGAQNLFVLEAGLKRSHHLTVSLVCFLCDFALIMLGVAGAATFFNMFPSMKFLIGLVGVTFLLLYGCQKFTEKHSSIEEQQNRPMLNWKRSAILAMTFSILNPHAYLDAFVLIGGYSSKYAELDQRLTLGMGAAIYSGLWFLLLSTCSSLMKPLFSNQQSMRVVSVCTGAILLFMCGKLALDVMSWYPPHLMPRAEHLSATEASGVLLHTSILY